MRILSCNCHYFIWCAAIDQEPWGLPRQEEPVACSGGLEAQFQRWQEDTGWRHCVLHHLHSESLALSFSPSLSLSLSLSHKHSLSCSFSPSLSLSHLNTCSLSLPPSLSLSHLNTPSLFCWLSQSLSFSFFFQNKRRWGGGGYYFTWLKDALLFGKTEVQSNPRHKSSPTFLTKTADGSRLVVSF